MSARMRPGPITAPQKFKEAVCIQTDKVYDSCRQKDCLEDVRVLFTAGDQQIIDRAINLKCRSARVIWVFSDVEPVSFKKGYYTVSLKYFFEVTLDAFLGVAPPTQVRGLATFDKTVILFGSEGEAKIFQSKFKEDAFDKQLWKKTNLPKSKVEVVDPICLSARLVDVRKCCKCNIDVAQIPIEICKCFDDQLVLDAERHEAFVSLGLFTIIKLERNVQLLIPAYDFCVPEKECIAATDEDPCELFERIDFPLGEFFPPQEFEFPAAKEPFRPCR